MMRLLALLLMLFVPSTARGQTVQCDGTTGQFRDMCLSRIADTAAGCAAVGNTLLRLACWDRLYRSPGTKPRLNPDLSAPLNLRWASSDMAPLTLSPSPDGTLDAPDKPRDATRETPWTILTDASPFSEHTDVFLSVPSDAVAQCGRRTRATLMLRCLEDQTSVHISHDCATPRTDGATWPVDLSLDDGTVTSDQMSVTDAGDGFGHFTYRDARTFIETLTAASSLRVQFNDLNGVQTRLRFPLEGLSAALPTLTQACHWSPTPPWADEATQDGG